MSTYNVTFSMQSFWHIGSGQEGGAYADALMLKSHLGLPIIPGKSIKGLLKEAFTKAEDNNWFDTKSLPLTEMLFGLGNTQGLTNQGLLQFTNAELHPAEQSQLIAEPQLKTSLYQVITNTAIDETTGVAKDTSLRSIEVCIPLTLQAQITINTNHHLYEKFHLTIGETFAKWLQQVLALITELGAKRHRGFGETIITMA